MNVLLLGKNSRSLQTAVRNSGCATVYYEDPIDADWLCRRKIGFIISYGYRHIIRKAVLDLLPEKIINLHVSLLPWNRGADPNIWSFLENTPKGVTIHQVEEGLDTGSILLQKKVHFKKDGASLKSTYELLSEEIESLFIRSWPDIMQRKVRPKPQPSGGSFHLSKDKEPYAHLLVYGWDTPVSLIQGKAI